MEEKTKLTFIKGGKYDPSEVVKLPVKPKSTKKIEFVVLVPIGGSVSSVLEPFRGDRVRVTIEKI